VVFTFQVSTYYGIGIYSDWRTCVGTGDETVTVNLDWQTITYSEASADLEQNVRSYLAVEVFVAVTAGNTVQDIENPCTINLELTVTTPQSLNEFETGTFGVTCAENGSSCGNAIVITYDTLPSWLTLDTSVTPALFTYAYPSDSETLASFTPLLTCTMANAPNPVVTTAT